MAEQTPNPFGVPPTVWITLVVACAGFFALKQNPLHDVRPADQPTHANIHEGAQEQDVEARLWEDPLGAVADVIAAKGSDAEHTSSVQASRSKTATSQTPVKSRNPTPGKGDSSPRSAVSLSCVDYLNHIKAGESPDVGAVPAAEHSLRRLRQSYSAYRAATPGSRDLLIAAMVSGAPYAEDVETRRRARYAVLAGLYRQGYMPRDGEHIGYVVLDDILRGAPLPHATVAFEWLDRDRTLRTISAQSEEAPPPSRVLLLWMDQDGLRDCPLTVLNGVANAIDPPKSEGERASIVPLAVLGPSDSDGLRSMAVELRTRADQKKLAAGKDAGNVKEFERRITIYSSRATVPDCWVYDAAVDPAKAIHCGAADPNAPAEEQVDVSLEKSFNSWDENVFFFRTVADDRSVVKQLLRELGDRHIDKSQIVLISERDTLYARLMATYFGRCANHPSVDPNSVDPEVAALPLCISYLRGLDGAVAKSARSGRSGSPADVGADEKAEGHGSSEVHKEATEAAIGRGQFDYLRRMTLELAAFRSGIFCLKAPRARGGAVRTKPECPRDIKAIGIVSSDVYDKLMILQALRPSFPEAVFFTFDMDARLIDQDNLRWTRQLVVGSSLGLLLRPELQGDIPFFRDTYQATTFLSTLFAVHDLVPQLSGVAELDAGSFAKIVRTHSAPLMGWASHPLVFEIGPGYAQTLSHEPKDASCTIGGRCEWVAPAVADRVLQADTHQWLFIGCLGAVVILLACPWIAAGTATMFTASARLSIRKKAIAPIWAGSGVVLIICLVLVSLNRQVSDYLSHRGESLPVPVVEVFARWGSLVLELLVIVVVITLVFRGQRKLWENACNIQIELRLPRSPNDLVRFGAQWMKAQSPGARAREWFWFPTTRMSQIPLPAASPPVAGLSALERLIALYLVRGSPLRRLVRVAIATGASSSFLWLLSSLGLSVIGLVSWFGSQIAQGLPGAIPIISMAAMQFLIFWVADALLLSRSFLLAVGEDHPQWPSQTIQSAALELGLPESHTTMWLELRLVAERTRWVANLIWYPCLIIAGMFAAVFTVQFGEVRFASDPTALLVAAAITVGAAVLLRRACETLRREAMDGLEDERMRVLGSSAQPLTATVQLDHLLDRIVNLRDGSFAPYSEQPVVRAFLVPVVTFAATSGIQYLRPG